LWGGHRRFSGSGFQCCRRFLGDAVSFVIAVLFITRLGGEIPRTRTGQQASVGSTT